MSEELTRKSAQKATKKAQKLLDKERVKPKSFMQRNIRQKLRL